MSETMKKILVLLVVFVVGGLVGYYSMPVKTTIKTEIKTVEVEKVVEKIVESKIEDKKENVKKNTTITEEKRPDGTIVTKTEIKDTIDSESHYKENKETNKETEKKTETIAKSETIKENLSRWKTNIMYSAVDRGALSMFNDPKNVGIGLEYRLIGPIFIGTYGFLNKTAGLSVGLNF